jgi:choline dehydrogenase-like flavoprotein
LGTTRIVLRSLNRYGAFVPLLANPYTYVPMLNLNMLGRAPSGPKHSLVQLCVVSAPRRAAQPLVHAHVHSYQSLLNFKLAKEFPLPYSASLRLAKWLVPCLAILAIDHEDRPGPGKYCWLQRGDAGGPDQLEIKYRLPDDLVRQQRRRESVLLREFLRFGCIPLRRIRPGYAASVHYGGTFPMTQSDKELTVDPSCRLRGTRSIYLADGSVFPHLPAKGLTFTMMANANRIGTHLCHILKDPCCELSSASV